MLLGCWLLDWLMRVLEFAMMFMCVGDMCNRIDHTRYMRFFCCDIFDEIYSWFSRTLEYEILSEPEEAIATLEIWQEVMSAVVLIEKQTLNLEN